MKQLKNIVGPAFAIAMAILLLAEGGARLFYSENISGRFDYGYHPTAGFVESKEGVQLVRAGGRRFREQSFPWKAPEGTRRLMVVGDSVPRGPSLEDAYIAQVPRLMTEEGKPAQGINMAVAGYGCRRAQIVFKHALTYHPDLMILHINDSNEFEDEREWQRSQEFASWHPRNWFMKAFIVRRLYEVRLEKWFWYMLPKEVRMQESVSDADAEVAAMADEETVARWHKRIAEKVREDVALAREAGVPVLLVSQCSRERDKEHEENGYLIRNDFLENLADSLTAPPEVMHVSMYEVFKDAPFNNEFADGAHLKQVGHERLSRAILEELHRNGW